MARARRVCDSLLICRYRCALVTARLRSGYPTASLRELCSTWEALRCGGFARGRAELA